MNFKNFLGLLFFISLVSNAQIVEIKGKITDEKNKFPLSGVNITIKNSTKGTSSDLEGNYTIKVNANSTLVFSIVGYATKEIQVIESKTINVTLQEEANKLEEVVVNVGYGTQKKKNLTSAISSIKSDTFDDRPLYNIGQAIQGNAAGVSATQPSGKPGVGLNISIRGLNSIQSGNNPLYVIDGIQTYSTDGLNTNDIVDLQILKDATATAIYGISGSSGVVIITTKKGKSNKHQFNFNSYIGTSKIVKNIDVLDLNQYKSLMSEISSAYVNDANNSLYTGINTNWRDEVFQTGVDRNADFSYAGGSEQVRAYASLGYQDIDGIVKPSNFTRISGKLNLDIDATSWLKGHANMNLLHTNLNNTNDNNNANQGGVILSTLTTPAFLPIYAEQLNGRVPDPITGEYPDGYKDGQFAANPVASLENPVAFQSRQEENNTMRYLGNLGLDITLAKNLIWKPISTVDMWRSVYEFFVDSYRSNYGRGNSGAPAEQKGVGRQHTSRYYNWNIENTVEYTIKKDNHTINLLAGNGVQKQRYDQEKIEGTGFRVDLRELDLSEMMSVNRFASDTIAKEKNYVSYFGRATYNFKGKYILNGVFRASGSSQLAPGKKWGYFPGVSAAWIVSNENFMKNISTFSELKLRGGWGQTGNISGVSEYSSFVLMNDDGATTLQNYENTDLTWETTTDLNIGLDIGLVKNRVRLTVDAYKKTTVDLINNINFPGVTTILTYNAGKLENKGIELSLNTLNFKGDFTWNTNFNISFNKNKILEMGYEKIKYAGYQGVNRYEEGQSLGNFYGYVVNQVNPTTGLLEYKDLNGDGVITPQDRTIIGNAMPDYTFGFTNNFAYKGFFLDTLFTGTQGNDIFNASRIDLEGMRDSKNQSVTVLDRWQQPGDITSIPKAGDPTANLVSDRWIEDGSYVRLKAVTFGYNFKSKFLGLDSLKIYATGQNLVTWTNYSGFDPEVNAYSSNTGTSHGIDYGTYPQVRTFVFGLKAGF